jgi:hypothetical protein
MIARQPRYYGGVILRHYIHHNDVMTEDRTILVMLITLRMTMTVVTTGKRRRCATDCHRRR